MTSKILGYEEDPSTLLKETFQKIVEQDMKDLPFLHPGVEVDTYGFQIFENQWVGALLTPWMLSILILPGPGQVWPVRKVSDKLGVTFPRGDATFMVGHIDAIGQYLSCSLMSPLDKKIGQFALSEMANQSVRELLTPPGEEIDPDAPESLKRRRIFLKQES